MNITIPLLTFIIPVFGIISGLSASITVPLFIISILFATKGKFVFHPHNYKLEALLIIWIFLSCLWSYEPSESLTAFIKIFVVVALGALSFTNVHYLKNLTPKIELSLMVGVATALAFFYIELITNGIISSTFRSLFQNNSNPGFLLCFLDRGCAILALTSWIIIGIFLKYKKYEFAIIYYFLIILTLAFSDNLAGFVSFSLSGIIFLFTRCFQFFRNPKTVCTVLTVVSFSMVIFCLSMQPKALVNKVESLPLSAKHRLFIWSFVGEKAIQNPIYGAGFSSSKFVSAKEQSFIEYEGHFLPLFPLHPHNNILQIFFETGLIGLILFISLGCKYIFYIGKNYQTDNETSLNLMSISTSCFATYMGIGMISYSMWQSWWVCIIVWIAIMFSLLLPNRG